MTDLDIGQGLIAADVHCADNAEPFAVSDGGAVFDSRFVFFELVFFLRDIGFAHEDEFGAEETGHYWLALYSHLRQADLMSFVLGVTVKLKLRSKRFKLYANFAANVFS